MRESLISKFKEAGLTLQLVGEPLVRFTNTPAGRQMFQLDIQKDKRGKEFFRIYPGADTNSIQVTSYDSRLQQVVLAVKENAVEFEEEIHTSLLRSHREQREPTDGNVWIDTMLRSMMVNPRNARVVKQKGTSLPKVFVLRKTPEGRRNFLAGVDERNLFICQLPKQATSVKAAHDMLKHPTVVMAEGLLKGKVIRQGEWFMVNPTPVEEQEIARVLKNKMVTIEKKCPIGVAVSGEVFRQGRQTIRQGIGNPHTADEVLIMPAPAGTGLVPPRREVFVRGAIRHVDHATVKLASWRRVLRNMEANQGAAMSGVKFID